MFRIDRNNNASGLRYKLFDYLSCHHKRFLVGEGDRAPGRRGEVVAQLDQVAGVGVEVVQGDGIAAIEGLSRKKEAFDIVIVAPPYGLGLQQKAIASLARYPILKPGGVIIVQREEREPQVAPPDGLAFVRMREYGRTVFDFYAQGAFGVQPLQKA